MISKYKNLLSTREETPFFYELLENYSLKIFFSDYTANMQSFIINHPTILIWDKKFLKPNQKYDHIYKKLEKSNILFFSTIKLKKFINEKINTFEKLIKWWNSKKVQNAKNLYLISLCRQNENLKNSFINNINSIS